MKSGRPAPGEFADYAASDIAYVEGDDAVNALRAQCDVVLSMLESVDEQSIAGRAYAPGKWTFKEVIGHMIDDERIFAYRALCVARRDPRPLPGFDEKTYVAATAFERRPLDSLMREYVAVRYASVALFDSLTDDEWRRRGEVNGYTASVRGLAFHIAGHELHHLRLLREKYV
ncbi:MAG TPA: DinB family protein [Thermoanaerobaculia bacterium]|nr:DinB family protein [Thermoanaerobaculia bacterium]